MYSLICVFIYLLSSNSFKPFGTFNCCGHCCLNPVGTIYVGSNSFQELLFFRFLIGSKCSVECFSQYMRAHMLSGGILFLSSPVWSTLTFLFCLLGKVFGITYLCLTNPLAVRDVNFILYWQLSKVYTKPYIFEDQVSKNDPHLVVKRMYTYLTCYMEYGGKRILITRSASHAFFFGKPPFLFIPYILFTSI